MNKLRLITGVFSFWIIGGLFMVALKKVYLKLGQQ
jgi:hypothetical protein